MRNGSGDNLQIASHVITDFIMKMFGQWTTAEVEAFATCMGALATLLLVIAGIFQLRLVRRANRLVTAQIAAQQNRWNREDQIRETQQALNYRFGIKAGITDEPRGPDVIVWVANLGTASFLVTRVWLDIVNPLNASQRLLRKKGFEWNAVVAAGETKEFRLPEGYLIGSPVDKDEFGVGYHKCEISIGIDYFSQQSMSPVKTFEAGVDEGRRLEMFSKPFEE